MLGDNDKRAAQTALPENIRELYQQILSEGSILADGESLTQQIAQGIFPEIELSDTQREIHREIDTEPER